MWKSIVNGEELTFYLVGINNQNFIMADHQTGTWWQQVTGEAIRGPLEGQQLEPLYVDEVSFEIWRREHPRSLVFAGEEAHADSYVLDLEHGDDSAGGRGDYPTLGLASDTELADDTLVVGVQQEESTKAYPISLLVDQNPIVDEVAGVPILLWIAPDERSVRGFSRRVDGQVLEFFEPAESGETDEPGEGDPDLVLVDAQTGSRWDFSGTAVSGALTGTRLERVATIKDYWFDWLEHNPETTIYSGGQLAGGISRE